MIKTLSIRPVMLVRDGDRMPDAGRVMVHDISVRFQK
jgi:hypothetical protein